MSMITHVPANALPCPFCGEMPTTNCYPLWSGDHGFVYEFGVTIGCNKCRYEFPAVTTLELDDPQLLEEKLVDKWNTRITNG